MLTRSKVKGMLVGGAIGDALGRPVESMSFAQSCENYPDGITDYVSPKNNKWFKDKKKGVITDDTQLTVSMMKALIRGNGCSMAQIARYHVLAMNESMSGWGGSTRDAVKKLAKGVSWLESGKSKKANRGLGNGAPMKIAPMAAWYASRSRTMKWFRFAEQVVKISAMTHYTRVSARAAVIHAMVLDYLLWSDLSRYRDDDLFEAILKGADGRNYKRDNIDRDHYYVGHLDNPENSETALLWNLIQLPRCKERWQLADLIKAYKNGNANVVNSLPFSYAFFLRNPFSVETLYNVAAAGGDSDTNAHFVGQMMGALHGIELFEEERNRHLITGLKCYDSLIKLADIFCDKFGVKDADSKGRLPVPVV